ncbi:META domain-containing protein [Ilumatobacter sp.]|uniref:META domain-containing protein n=1 Tax=Ilumatobacter sp. TaxID=1967498 RepID=UPI003B529B37
MVMLVRAGDGATGVDTDVASSPLVGEWTITDIDGIEPLADAPATITFGDDDTMSLDTGCNTLSASYGIDGDALSIDSEPAMTLMACDTERTAQETAVVAIIGSVRTDGATFEISDDTTLTITTIEGTTLTVER